MSKNDDRRGAPHGIQRLCLAMAMIAGFAVTTASCSSSVTTGGTSSTGTSSSTGAGTCTGSCTKNADCSGQGPLIVCRACQCVNLTTELCTTIYTTGAQEEALADDNALYLGSILPTSGFDLDFGLIVQDAIKLAISDFAQGGGIPLPGGTGTRPIVLVGCSDGPNEDEYQAAAKHLVNDLGVQAIIGHAFSGATIQIATDVTIPAGVLLFSPTASSDDISTLVDNDLVWRAATPDSFQGTALASYYPEVAASAQQHYPAIPGGPSRWPSSTTTMPMARASRTSS